MPDRDDALDLAQLRGLSGGAERIDVACPLCGPWRRTPSNRSRKVLRIWDDGSFVTYKCARCEAHGWARDASGEHHITPRPGPWPAPRQQPAAAKAALAAFLWGRSRPLAGTVAATYLQARCCFIDHSNFDHSNLRFLPARGAHPPAMIAQFCPTGVHLTKLKADGSGKAGTANDKIMLGPSVGYPIVIADNPDHAELVVTEGIEDAASLALATGWTAWAAGSAGRIAGVLPAAKEFERVFIGVDCDAAGRAALDRARAVRADVIPLHIAKALGRRHRLDANQALIRYGADVVLAAIEWCDAQNRFATGQIGFHAMQRDVGRAERIFKHLMAPSAPHRRP
jgi:hypothetical protein